MVAEWIAWLSATGPVWPWIGAGLVAVFVVDALVRRWRADAWKRARRFDDENDRG
jgi:hypothetical protein